MVDGLVGLVSQFHVAGNDVHDWENAKLHHKGWKERLSQYIDGYGSMSESEATNHHNCKFGQWYYAIGKDRFSHIAEVAEIELPHQQMHAVIKEIVRLKEMGDPEAAKRELDKVEQTSATIMKLIERIEKQV